MKASFEIIKEILTLRINEDETCDLELMGSNFLLMKIKIQFQATAYLSLLKGRGIKSLIVHDETSQMKQQYIYGDWTKFSGLSLFPQIIGISDSIPIDAPDKFELVSEINLLEFEPTAPKNAVNQFHYNAHI